MRTLGRFNLVKAEANPDQPNTARIQGVISTDDTDLQGESVAQGGLDFDYFLKKGWLNYDHKAGIENILGYPLKVERSGNKTHLTGVLLLDKPLAREIYDTAQSLAKAGAPRSLGFSVEGHVIERDRTDPKRITRAKVINVAITPSPINPQTQLELLKSLVGYQTPSATGSGLAALVPQQLDPVLSSADSRALNGLYDERLASTIKGLYAQFPSVDLKDILDAAHTITQQTGEARQ